MRILILVIFKISFLVSDTPLFYYTGTWYWFNLLYLKLNVLFQMKDTSLLNYVTVSDIISSSTTAPKISKFTSETPIRYRWTFSFRPSPLFCFIFPLSILTLHSDELSLYVEFNSLTLFHIYIYYINTTQKTYKTLPVPHKAPSSDFLVNISPKGPL